MSQSNGKSKNHRVLITGSVALDTVKTPFGEKKDILGGSASHASVAASFYAPVNLVGAVGTDFPVEHRQFLEGCGVDCEGLDGSKGKTFRWEGYYEYDMNQAHTVDTQLNILAEFQPKIPARYESSPYILLANLDPILQKQILGKMKSPKVIGLDTMNFWISSKRDAIIDLLPLVNFLFINEAEARQLMDTPSLPLAAQKIIDAGAKAVVIKKGEHGALYYNGKSFFIAPSYPQTQLIDPTGAGDSFAGGFMGYLAKTGDMSEANIRRAVIIGSVMASFNIEDFSMDRMKKLTHREIVERFEEFQHVSRFEPLAVSHWM